MRFLAVLASLLAGGAHAEEDPLAEIRRLAADHALGVALERLDRFLAAHPGHVEGRLYRGVILTRQGRLEEATEMFSALAREHPELPEPHNNLAVLHAAEGRYEEARAALLRALELAPGYPTAHENLGDVYAKLASLAYERAHDLDPANRRALEKARLLTRTFELETSLAAGGDRPGHGPSGDRAAMLAETEAEQGAAPAPAEALGAGDPGADAAVACYAVRRLEREHDARSLAAWLDTRGALETEVRAEPLEERLGYRVYLPPLESRAAAEVQIARLKGEGLTDLMRIADGPLANGVALGVYRTERAAARRAAALEAMGYRPDVEPRTRAREAWSVEARLAAGAAPPPLPEGFAGRAFEPTPCR